MSSQEEAACKLKTCHAVFAWGCFPGCLQGPWLLSYCERTEPHLLGSHDSILDVLLRTKDSTGGEGPDGLNLRPVLSLNTLWTLRFPLWSCPTTILLGAFLQPLFLLQKTFPVPHSALSGQAPLPDLQDWGDNLPHVPHVVVLWDSVFSVPAESLTRSGSGVFLN